MEITKVKNYKEFAQKLMQKTGCEVCIKIMGSNHMHYQLTKNGISLGVLCINSGEVSFAPFVTHGNVRDEQYINMVCLSRLDDFIAVLKVFGALFVCEEGN